MPESALVVGQAESRKAVDGYDVNSLQSEKDACEGAVEAAGVHQQAADLSALLVQPGCNPALHVFAEALINSYCVTHRIAQLSPVQHIGQSLSGYLLC